LTARATPSALAVALALLATGGHARAEVASAVYTFSVTGVRFSTGELAKEVVWSPVLTFGVALQPLRLGERGRLGPCAWIQLDWPVFTTAQAPGGSNFITHLGGGLRVELAVPKLPVLDIILLGGVEVVRAKLPLPPDRKTEYWGGVVGFGLEYGGAERATALTATFGLLGSGPKSVSVILSFDFGAP
jgi:hypothetical protein